jgi:hypothetical protein
MYCTQCGAKAAPDHKFCAGCGARLEGAGTGAAPMAFAAPDAPAPVPAPSGPLEDWRETTNYRVVLSHPDVKGLIADASKTSKAGMSADEFLKLAAPVLGLAGAETAATKLIAEYAPGFYAKMGVKVGKETRNGYATSFGRTLAAILCSLASRSQTLVAIHEASDGCVVEADVPSSLTTSKGKLTLTLERRPEGTLVQSAVVFPGQSGDWGRSKRVLDELHQDILNYRTLQP